MLNEKEWEKVDIAYMLCFLNKRKEASNFLLLLKLEESFSKKWNRKQELLPLLIV